MCNFSSYRENWVKGYSPVLLAMGPITKKKCTRCNVNLPIAHFEKKRSGEYMKMCNQCREVNRTKAQNRKCEHDRTPEQCKACRETPKKHKLCNGNKQKLCKCDCGLCNSKSFTIVDKAEYWDYSKNKVNPRDIFRSTNKKHWFICPECKHSFIISPNEISAGKWCV